MKHFLNGIEISPRNRESIGVISNFTGDPNELSLNVDSIILPREANDIIRNHIQTSGLFIGLPYQVELEGGITLDYYVDLTEKPIVKLYEVEVKIKRRKGIDDFLEKARGTSFELMAKKGVDFDVKLMPYFVIKDNIPETTISLSIMLYVLGRELLEATLEAINAINDLIEASTPLVGATLAGVPIFAINTPGIIRASLNVLFRLAYFAAVLILITELAGRIFLVLFPPRRWLKGCYYKELWQKGCEYLGYQFESSLLDNDSGWFLLPVPLQDENESIWEKTFSELIAPFNKGYPTSSDSVGLFGDFIEECKKQFNAEVFISNGVVRLERRDYVANLAPNIILPALSLQADRDDAFTYNTEDAWKRYYIRYTLDFTDLHIVEGNMLEIHDAEFSTENSVPVTDEDLVLIKGLQEVPIAFSLGANKSKLNLIELIGLGTFAVIDFATYVFTFGFGGTNFTNIITDRLAALQISQQYFSVTKSLFVVDNGTKTLQGVTFPKVKFADNYRLECSAEKLWNSYHYINDITENDFLIRENIRFRLRANEFVNLLNTNYALIDGKVCELLKIEWIDEEHFAQVTYKEPFDWANGKVNILRVDD
jgi:hypothetical protein